MGKATAKGLWHNECVPPTKAGAHTLYNDCGLLLGLG